MNYEEIHSESTSVTVARHANMSCVKHDLTKEHLRFGSTNSSVLFDCYQLPCYYDLREFTTNAHVLMICCTVRVSLCGCYDV